MKQEELVVTIEKIVPNGYGLAFSEGLTIFVSLAAKGDNLRIRIREKKGKVAFAEIIEVITASPDRVEPECQYFGKCGGCDFQQMSYQAQLESKVAIIRDCLRRIGKLDFAGEIPIIASPAEFGYRSRAQWHADTRNQRIGYFKRNSHQVIDTEECPIIDAKLQETLADFRKNLNWSEFWAEHVEIETSSNGSDVSTYSAELIEPTRRIGFAAFGVNYFYDSETFFQGNLSLVEKLIETAVGGEAGENAIDLFCGVGLFSLALAKNFKKVTGIEANAKSIDFARENAEQARIDNVEFHTENVSDWLRENRPQKMDLVVLDPPRTGADSETLEGIMEMQPTRISYVSCDPATLARDLKVLCGWDYVIESVTALDMFPQTHHVETVVRLKKKAE